MQIVIITVTGRDTSGQPETGVEGIVKVAKGRKGTMPKYFLSAWAITTAIIWFAIRQTYRSAIVGKRFIDDYGSPYMGTAQDIPDGIIYKAGLIGLLIVVVGMVAFRAAKGSASDQKVLSVAIPQKPNIEHKQNKPPVDIMPVESKNWYEQAENMAEEERNGYR